MEYNKKTNKNLSALVYKILNDILALLLIAFFLFLLAEGILPGIISARFSLLKLILIILAVLGSIIFLGRQNNFQFSGSSKKNHWIIATAVIFFFVLMANSLLKFSFWEILIITPLSCFVLIYFYKVFREN